MFVSRATHSARSTALASCLPRLACSHVVPLHASFSSEAVAVQQAEGEGTSNGSGFMFLRQRRVLRAAEGRERSLAEREVKPYEAPTLQAWVTDLNGRRKGIVELDPQVFGLPIRPDIIHRVVRWQLAKARQGFHMTKNRAEVTGSMRKIRPQKGQGMARVSTAKAPQFRGGGKAHGKRPRSFAFDLPKQVRNLGLRTMLSAKFAEGNLIVIDTAALYTHKTKGMTFLLDRLKWRRSLIIDEEFDNNFKLACKSVDSVDLLPTRGANVNDVLRHPSLVLTLRGLRTLEARLLYKEPSPPSPLELSATPAATNLLLNPGEENEEEQAEQQQ